MTFGPAAALDDLQRRTTERLAALTGDYAGIVEASKDSNADDEHDPEGATIAFERSQVGTLVEEARHQLAEVEAARARLADGTYGTCERCGEPIGEGRLEARPTARTCIRCAAGAS
jgi:RNA polymerase-binding transcription factor